MATLNEIARLRKAYFRELKRRDRAIDTVQEAIQRKIVRVLGRKRNVPDLEDLRDVLDLAQELQARVVALATALAAGYPDGA